MRIMIHGNENPQPTNSELIASNQIQTKSKKGKLHKLAQSLGF